MWSAVMRRRRVNGMTLSPSFGRYCGTLNDAVAEPGIGGTKPPPRLIICASCWGAVLGGSAGPRRAGSAVGREVRSRAGRRRVRCARDRRSRGRRRGPRRSRAPLFARSGSPGPRSPSGFVRAPSPASAVTMALAGAERARGARGAFRRRRRREGSSSIWQRSRLDRDDVPSLARSFATRPPWGPGARCRPCRSRSRASGWSFLTMSPSRTSHFVMVPSETLSPSWGMVTSMSIGAFLRWLNRGSCID